MKIITVIRDEELEVVIETEGEETRGYYIERDIEGREEREEIEDIERDKGHGEVVEEMIEIIEIAKDDEFWRELEGEGIRMKIRIE